MKVIHLWLDYSPNLFDRSHLLCLENGLNSEVVCQAFIINGARALPNTYFVRTRKPEESNSQDFFTRLSRFIRRKSENRRFVALVSKRIFTEKVDIVHCHFGTTAAILAQYEAIPDIPLIVSFYGVDISQSLNNKAILKAYKVIFEKAMLLHVLCDEAKNRLVSLGCPKSKICITNLPIDLHSIPEIGVKFVGATRFLIPARFVEKKGHLILLKAFRQLVNAGYKVSLTCFGYGPVDWLLHAIDDLALNNVVKVIDNKQNNDFLKDYIKQLREHDVVLAPSVRAVNGDDEGGPALSIIVAQAAGKPIIASDFPGAERSINNGVEGLIVKAGDEHALYAAMVSLISNWDTWDIFGNAGKTRARKDFADDKYWTALSDWYSIKK